MAAAVNVRSARGLSTSPTSQFHARAVPRVHLERRANQSSSIDDLEQKFENSLSPELKAKNDEINKLIDEEFKTGKPNAEIDPKIEELNKQLSPEQAELGKQLDDAIEKEEGGADGGEGGSGGKAESGNQSNKSGTAKTGGKSGSSGGSSGASSGDRSEDGSNNSEAAKTGGSNSGGSPRKESGGR